jgi:hypothetical protein
LALLGTGLKISWLGGDSSRGGSACDEENEEEGREDRDTKACKMDGVADHVTASLWRAAG